MSQSKWKTIAELIGISAIVASLLFVGMQLKQDRELALAEASITTFGNLIALRNQRFDNIRIWNNGNAGIELDADEKTIYRDLIVGAHQSGFFIWSSFDRAGLDNVDFAISDFAGFLYQYPAARREWETYVDEVDSFRTLPGEESRRNVNWESIVRLRLKKIGQAYD